MGSWEGREPQTDKTPAANSLYNLQVSFLYSDIWHCIMSVLSFYAPAYIVHLNLFQMRISKSFHIILEYLQQFFFRLYLFLRK
jgi:hypothetical protein